jgi:hypothetical protein
MNYNPYAPPGASPYAVPAYPPGTGAVGWVDGERIVLPNGAPLPAVCLKCGSYHQITFKRQKFVWQPQWVIAIVAASWLIGLVVMLALQKRSEFHLPLCPTCFAKWKRANLIAVLVGLAIIPVGILAAVLGAVLDDSDVVGAMLALGFVGWLIALIVVLFVRSKATVVPRKIDRTHTWLGGVHANAMRVLAGG